MTLKKPLKKINKIIIVKITTQLSHYFLFNTKMTRLGIHSQRQILPVNQICTYGMPPMPTVIFRQNGLIKEVPTPLPETQSIG